MSLKSLATKVAALKAKAVKLDSDVSVIEKLLAGEVKAAEKTSTKPMAKKPAAKKVGRKPTAK